MAISAFIVLVIMTLQFSKSTLFNLGSEYRVRIRFDSASGVTIGVPVFKSGVEIGRVSRVQLVDNDREVEITTMIRSDRIIYSNEECRLKPAMLLGKTSLEFVRKDNSVEEATPLATDGTVILRGVVPTDIFNSFNDLEGDLSKAVQTVSDAAGNLATFLGGMNMLLGDKNEIALKQEQLHVLLNETTNTIRDMRVLIHNTNNIIGDPTINANLRTTAQSIPGLIAKVDNTIGSSGEMVTEIRHVIGQLETNMNSLMPVIQAIQGDVPAITGSIKKGSARLENIFDEVAMLVEAVNKADGTIKKLINDPALYNSVLDTVENAERLTSDLRPILHDVKPITNNVRIITDKIARNPSSIITGVFRKSPPIKGGLPSWGDGLGSDCISGDCFDEVVLRANAEETNAAKRSCLFGTSRSPRERYAPAELPTFENYQTPCNDCGHAPQIMPLEFPDCKTVSAPREILPVSHPPISLTPNVVSIPTTVQTAEFNIPRKNTPAPKM